MSRAWACLTVVTIAGCAGGPANAPASQREAPPARAPEHASAADLARSIVDARAGGLFEVTDFRFHPTAGAAIGELAHWAEAVDKLGLDPMRDVDRAFVAARNSGDATGVAILQMGADDQTVGEAIRRAGGRAGDGAPYPRASIPIRRYGTHVAALMQPRLLVIVPQHLEGQLERLRQPAMLPPRSGRAAAQFFAYDPSSSLGGNPKWPQTLIAAHAELEFARGGGAVVRFFAESTSAAQAQRDALALTNEAKRLLTVNLGLFEMHLLDPPKFASLGSRVTMESTLLPTDVDWLLRFNGAL